MRAAMMAAVIAATRRSRELEEWTENLTLFIIFPGREKLQYPFVTSVFVRFVLKSRINK